jgi:dihydrolipoamide dehydrogenase
MTERYDVIVVGMGPGGEVAAGRLLAAGRHVAVIERELIGGECAYWACIPSKTLLRPPEARREAERAAGTSRPDLDWPALRDYRDYMIRHLDDAAQIEGYEHQGATVVKGKARLSGPGRVEVDGRTLEAEHVIVATGSEPARPPIDGLERAEVWTNREATTLRDIPDRAVLIGGSAVGVELGHFLGRMGSQVTVIERGERLLEREEPRVSELTRGVLDADGVDVRTGRQARRITRARAVTTVELDDDSRLETDVVILGAGRTPRTEGLGLDTVGVTLTERGAIPVDEHCRVTEGLWAIGDVTGIALFTHVAMYQGRVVADTILGRSRVASYEGIPRVVFADPEIAAVGLTAAHAEGRGIALSTAEIDLAETLARPWTYEQDPTGTLGVLADRNRGVLVGAWAVAPLAGEWIHQAALAIRAQVPIDVLLDQVAQYPTYSEGYLNALEGLAL